MVMNGRVTSNRDGSVIGSLKALEIIKLKKWDVLVAGHGTDTSKKKCYKRVWRVFSTFKNKEF